MLFRSRASLKRTFDQHRIPFVTTAAAPLLEQPAAKTVLQLAALPLTNYFRVPVMDVLTSPVYRHDQATVSGTKSRVKQAPGAVQPRPDLWPSVVRALGITRGEEEWKRLASAGSLQTGSWSDEDDDSNGWNATTVDASQVDLLWRLVSDLIEDCRRLPQQGSVGELTDAFYALARAHLDIPGLDQESKDGGQSETAVGTAIGAVLRDVRELDRLGETVSWEEWAGLLARAMERAVLPVEPFTHRGVQVLDAMAARGLPFRALILLGLNETVFPRTIREDAFLRDRTRKVLGETLGYKIDEKLVGYEEERLLFELLVQSAGDRLVLCYQRADAEGRPLATSSCLDPWLRAGESPSRTPDVVVPRRLSDRLGLPLFATPWLTRKELSVGLVLQGCDPAALLDAAQCEPALFRHGVEALRETEGTSGNPGAHDGLTGPLERHWAGIMAQGMAPTPLERYARCPFQYFSADVLGLEQIGRAHV